MPTTLYKLAELPAELRQRWIEVLAANPSLPGPAFHPDLFCTIGAHFDSCYVAVLGEGDSLGFFPFLRDEHHKIALPVPMCDYQAIIGAPGRKWELDRVLADLDLVAWDFDYLIGIESLSFTSAFLESGSAPRINARKGSEAYFEEMRLKGVSLRSLMGKREKLQKKHGALRFEAEAEAPAVVDEILRWKADRFYEGRPMDPRVRITLEKLRGKGALSGVTSALYAGGELVAAHFGLKSDGVLYYWFPGFSPKFSHFTPGHILVYELVTHLEAMGCEILDFGPGGEAYKRYFCNDTLPISRGGIERFSRFTLARKCRRHLEGAVRSTKWLYAGMRPLVRKFRALKARQ